MRRVSDDGLRAAEEKMAAADVPDAFVATFRHYYRQLEQGESGLLPDSGLEPVSDLASAEDLPADPVGEREALAHAVVLKLNGGLGTSMGMAGPKSLLPVKSTFSFLDIVARQVVELRRRHDVRLPLVLMNSFATREPTLRALESHDRLLEGQDVPLDFVQHREPKLLADGLEPASWPKDPGLEWAPPGHGDLYAALVTSGMLERLLEAGHRYAFVSNIDNLGAVLDPRILAWFAREGTPFLMEVADRTEADRKGGHLAARSDGDGLVLREIAQTPDDDVDSFQDTERWRYFNTNTLWVDLRALDALLREREGVLGLPMIVNRKTLDAGDSSSPAVIQIETAMGAAIGVFEGARALRVPRERFAPVKTTNDLLGLRSDAYVLTEDGHVALNPARTLPPPFVDLDPEHYKLIADFDRRFPNGPASLLECERFVVRGDVTFGAGVVARGRIELDAPRPRRIRSGAEIGD
jgi:UTP--glucose-1-phosphate uridylyltransferase